MKYLATNLDFEEDQLVLDNVDCLLTAKKRLIALFGFTVMEGRNGMYCVPCDDDGRPQEGAGFRLDSTTVNAAFDELLEKTRYAVVELH